MIPQEAIYFEDWRYIAGKSAADVIENRYMISNLGRVYSFAKNRLLVPVEMRNGYMRVALRLNSNICRYFSIHRLVMIEFYYIDNYEDMQVNHKNGLKYENHKGNLEWMTSSQNIQHAYDTGLKTKAKGEDCSYATITNDQAEQVAYLLSQNKYFHKDISAMTGIPLYIVDNIANGSTWKVYYDKYNLQAVKREPRPGFTDDQLHLLCKYFEEKGHLYIIKTDLYRDALMELFGINYTTNMSASMSRIYNHKTRRDITDQYNF